MVDGVDDGWVHRQPRGLAKQLRRSLDVTVDDRELTIDALLRATGGSAAPTVVTDDFALSAMTDGEVLAALGAAAELLAGSGRLGIRELCLRPDVVDAERIAVLQEAASAVFATELRPRPPSTWWEMLESSGFAVVHRLDGDVKLPRDRSRRRLGRRYATELGIVGLAAIPSRRGNASEPDY